MTACRNKVYSILGFKMRLRWLETHHLYYGLILMLLSPLSPYMAVILVVGLYLSLDDLYQHHRQVKEYSPCYHSPVHRFIYDYLKLYDRAWYRALNKFADWLFRNPLMIGILACIVILILMMKGC
jgi:hypothetical protein